MIKSSKGKFLGNHIAGNFLIEKVIGSRKIVKLEKRAENLYARFVGSKTLEKLSPMDSNAQLCVSKFSDSTGEDNESIYVCETFGDTVTVILYLYKDVHFIYSEKEALNFYLARDERNNLEEKRGISSDDEKVSQFLSEEFIHNKSIFVIDRVSGKTTDSFEMYGKDYIATCRREKPGLYQISKMSKKRKNIRFEEIIQITGIQGFAKFINIREALSFEGEDFQRKSVETNELFNVWEKFTEFENEIVEKKIIEKGFVRYYDSNFDGEFITFFFKKTEEVEFFREKEKLDYELIIEPEDIVYENVEQILVNKRKAKNNRNVKFLRDVQNINLGNKSVSFKYTDFLFNVPQKGIISVSNWSAEQQKKRRKEIIEQINSKKSITSNIIMNLCNGKADTQQGSTNSAVTENMLKEMFGDKNFKITENYREALDIAINTPDIALIQGPPGTGKTTLIKGIVTRINTFGKKNYKILLSSEQHDALENVVEKVSKNEGIPPFVFSKKFDEENVNIRFLESSERFKENLLSCCDILLEKESKRNNNYLLEEAIYILAKIKDSNFSRQVINEYFQSLLKILFKLEIYESVKESIDELEMLLGSKLEGCFVEAQSYEVKQIKKKLSQQIIDKCSFYSDLGYFHLEELQRTLKKHNFNEYLLDEALFIDLKSNDVRFIEYVDYVNDLHKYFADVLTEKAKFEFNLERVEVLIDLISEEIKGFAKKPSVKYLDIIDNFKMRLNDMESVSEVIKNYTSILGSTTAQSWKKTKYFDVSQEKYDYVIIDEAARANPIDIMAPILLGTKVILIGDQKQLPHFIDQHIVNNFESFNKNSNDDISFLKKSLFEVIYENVEKSFNEGRIKFKRHVRIGEQHRMHPVIGDFISEQFYGGKGKILNGKSTELKVNNFNVFNGKNIVWSDVPIMRGREEGKTFRTPEVSKVCDILQQIFNNNGIEKLKLEKTSIGVISFYNEQIDKLKNEIENRFTTQQKSYIEVGTVDSFQGKEFDILILSTVRSNENESGTRSLGFIFHSDSRINVALSRGKKLLVVVGDSETMMKSDSFCKFFEYVKDVGHYEL